MAKKSEKTEKQQNKKIEVEEKLNQEEVQEEVEKKVTPEEEVEKEAVEEEKEPTTEEKLAELQDRYLRLSAEYDNFRKRTLKEKIDLQKSANERLLEALLPVADDFDRALQSVDDAKDLEAERLGSSQCIAHALQNLVSLRIDISSRLGRAARTGCHDETHPQRQHPMDLYHLAISFLLSAKRVLVNPPIAERSSLAAGQ